ncbi:ribosomal RNA small subunit methyltransferase A [Anaerotignum neopropionicum]|uniref:Ribosomal RNA small subunit methyltransferase A n=1 Tax=Anaerotignum neopropionicum TaxID=36847 RepID=A0A136WBP9_9FIRM|nr:16S rRNA (adenine(1518)-N(6)/adenine(1519)-N(6))-dimethyltransferase RsmA [Anaerotignum neopropionicum]KXL51944.1 ribosomal RNA small subunit methyltransferase A [Anaerotignum neopropionicum]
MTERISTPSKTKQIIEENGFFFKKNFGQNFLIDSNILENIAHCAGITKEDCVLEIGPGIGSLTQVLAETAREVVAVEIDSSLIPILNQTLNGYDNIEILNQDILKADIDAIIEEKNSGKPIKVVANLPYYITTPIIMDLLEKERHIDTITVMVQKEVAERMQASPKEKEYGALSIAVQYYCDAHLDMIVQPSCFMPRPKVASAVITLQVLPERKVKTKDEALFFHLVKSAFGQRRKTLLNCLFNLGKLNLSKEELTSIIVSLGWDERIRGEALGIEEFAALTDVIYQKLYNAF